MKKKGIKDCPNISDNKKRKWRQNMVDLDNFSFNADFKFEQESSKKTIKKLNQQKKRPFQHHFCLTEEKSSKNQQKKIK